MLGIQYWCATIPLFSEESVAFWESTVLKAPASKCLSGTSLPDGPWVSQPSLVLEPLSESPMAHSLLLAWLYLEPIARELPASQDGIFKCVIPLDMLSLPVQLLQPPSYFRTSKWERVKKNHIPKEPATLASSRMLSSEFRSVLVAPLALLLGEVWILTAQQCDVQYCMGLIVQCKPWGRLEESPVGFSLCPAGRLYKGLHTGIGNSGNCWLSLRSVVYK